MGGRGLEREGRRKGGREIAFGCRMIMVQADPRRSGCFEGEDGLEIVSQSLVLDQVEKTTARITKPIFHFLALGTSSKSTLLTPSSKRPTRFDHVAH